MHVRERSQHVLSLGDDGGRTWSQEKHASAIRAGPRRLKPSSLARRTLQWDERLHAGLNACAQSLGGKGQAACCFPADGDDAQQDSCESVPGSRGQLTRAQRRSPYGKLDRRDVARARRGRRRHVQDKLSWPRQGQQGCNSRARPPRSRRGASDPSARHLRDTRVARRVIMNDVGRARPGSHISAATDWAADRCGCLCTLLRQHRARTVHSACTLLSTQAKPSTNRFLWPGFILSSSAIAPASALAKPCSEAIVS